MLDRCSNMNIFAICTWWFYSDHCLYCSCSIFLVVWNVLFTCGGAKASRPEWCTSQYFETVPGMNWTHQLLNRRRSIYSLWQNNWQKPQPPRGVFAHSTSMSRLDLWCFMLSVQLDCMQEGKDCTTSYRAAVDFTEKRPAYKSDCCSSGCTWYAHWHGHLFSVALCLS